MTMSPMKVDGMRAWRDIAPPLVAVLLFVGCCTRPAVAEPADARASAETARSAAAGPSRNEAKLPPGQRMMRRVLRDAFPKPAKLHTPPARQPTAVGGIPARNAIGLRLATPSSPVVAPHPPVASGGHMLPNAAIASPARTDDGRLAVQPRGPGPAVPAANTLRPAGINGTTMARSSSAPVGIGGSARSVTGINGTSVRPKRPN